MRRFAVGEKVKVVNGVDRWPSLGQEGREYEVLAVYTKDTLPSGKTFSGHDQILKLSNDGGYASAWWFDETLTEQEVTFANPPQRR